MNKMYAIGAIIVVVLVVFFAIGGFSSPYAEEDWEEEGIMSGAWGTKLTIIDTDGNEHEMAPGQAAIKINDVMIKSIIVRLAVKATPEIPGEITEVTFDFSPASEPALRTNTELYKYPANTLVSGYDIDQTYTGNPDKTIATDGEFYNILSFPLPVDYPPGTLDEWFNTLGNEGYKLHLEFTGTVDYTTDAGTSGNLPGPENSFNIMFEKTAGGLTFEWDTDYTEIPE